MYRLILWIGILVVVAACSTQKGVVKVEVENEITEDSVEYAIETFDGKFESWYLMQKSPARYRSLEYYENWNRQYVSEWNYRAMSGRAGSFFEPIVGYDPTEEYGFNLNHELFHYFQYVENVLKIPILPNSPKTVFY